MAAEGMMPSLDPAAFLSYARADDRRGDISALREALQHEIEVHIGRPFPIFQDRDDIAWGQNWRRRIDESLWTTTFLIAVLTPSFFQSAHCRHELETFLARERDLGRDDLVLPLYYIECDELTPGSGQHDVLASALGLRQYADWRVLRFEPTNGPSTRRALAKLADDVRRALRRPGGADRSGGGTSQESAARAPQRAPQARAQITDPWATAFDNPRLGHRLALALLAVPGAEENWAKLARSIQTVRDLVTLADLIHNPCRLAYLANPADFFDCVQREWSRRPLGGGWQPLVEWLGARADADVRLRQFQTVGLEKGIGICNRLSTRVYPEALRRKRADVPPRA